MKKHICIITTVHVPFDARIFTKEAKSLKAHGYEVTFIAPYHEDTEIDGIKIIGIQPPENRKKRILYSIFKVFDLALAQNAEVYHLHDPELMILGRRLTSKKKKVIFDAHENYYKDIKRKYWIPALIRRPVAALYRGLEKISIGHFSGVVAATDEIHDMYKMIHSNVVVVKNYPVLKSTPLPIKTSSFDGLHLIYIGGINKTRGIEEMLAAVDLIKDRVKVQLTLVGRFQNSVLETEILSRNYSFLNYVGWKAHEEVFEYLLDADMGLVLLHPLEQLVESLPVKLFEYMNSGIPVLASNFKFWEPYILEQGCGYMVDPLNIDAIAEKLLEISSQKTLLEVQGLKGRKAIEEKFNWEIESQKLLHFYENLF